MGLCRWKACLCLILICIGWIDLAQADSPDATAKLNMMRLRSSFIMKIIQHVEWPAQSSEDTASKVHIAVIGGGDAFDVLIEVVSKSQHPDRISVRVAGPQDDLSNVDVVLISSGKIDDLEVVLASLSDSPTLVVSDHDGFCEAGAMVNFIVQKTKRGSKLRFEINRGRAEAAGLKISSQLMKGNIDLVLIDIQMPKMSGLEATEAIRSWEKEEQRSPIPIIGLSANAMAGDAEKALSAGMNDYLTKPINPQKLYECIERWAEGVAEKKSDAGPKKQV